MSTFLRHSTLLHIDSHIRRETGQAFNDMLILVSEVSSYYSRRINGKYAYLCSCSVYVTEHCGIHVFEKTTVFVFDDVFGRYLDAFYVRKAHVIESMWRFQLGEGTVLPSFQLYVIV